MYDPTSQERNWQTVCCFTDEEIDRSFSVKKFTTFLITSDWYCHVFSVVLYAIGF